MSVKLLTEHHLEFLSLKGGAKARLSLRLSKCHIVGNYISWLKFEHHEALSTAVTNASASDAVRPCNNSGGRISLQFLSDF